MYTLYGIKNCDTVRKARKWLNNHAVEYQFHDFKTDGLNAERLYYFAHILGWQSLLNRNSTSWRQLDADQQAALLKLQMTEPLGEDALAIHIILASPTLLKRPILDLDGRLIVGFKSDSYLHLG